MQWRSPSVKPYDTTDGDFYLLQPQYVRRKTLPVVHYKIAHEITGKKPQQEKLQLTGKNKNEHCLLAINFNHTGSVQTI